MKRWDNAPLLSYHVSEWPGEGPWFLKMRWQSNTAVIVSAGDFVLIQVKFKEAWGSPNLIFYFSEQKILNYICIFLLHFKKCIQIHYSLRHTSTSHKQTPCPVSSVQVGLPFCALGSHLYNGNRDHTHLMRTKGLFPQKALTTVPGTRKHTMIVNHCYYYKVIDTVLHVFPALCSAAILWLGGAM